MTETEVGIGLSGPLLHAQTLGHEQRGGLAAQARKVLAQYQQTILVTVVRLYKALGGGWSPG